MVLVQDPLTVSERLPPLAGDLQFERRLSATGQGQLSICSLAAGSGRDRAVVADPGGRPAALSTDGGLSVLEAAPDVLEAAPDSVGADRINRREQLRPAAKRRDMKLWFLGRQAQSTMMLVCRRHEHHDGDAMTGERRRRARAGPQAQISERFRAPMPLIPLTAASGQRGGHFRGLGSRNAIPRTFDGASQHANDSRPGWPRCEQS